MKKILLFCMILLLMITLFVCVSKKEDIVKENTSINSDEVPEKKEETKSELINCKECVFSFYSEHKKIGDKLSEFTKDYSKITDEKGKQRKRFLGHIINNNNKILRAFVCGIENEKVFCLDGTAGDTAFKDNISILEKVFDGRCMEYENYYACNGDVIVEVYKNGNVSISQDKECKISVKDKEMYCN